MKIKTTKMMKPVLVCWTFVLLLSSCDFDTVGEICNQKDQDVELVVSPCNPGESGLLNNPRLELIRLDSANATGYFLLRKDACAIVAMGFNRFLPEDFSFDYIEVRTDTDTTIFYTRKEIHHQFSYLGDHHYRWTLK